MGVKPLFNCQCAFSKDEMWFLNNENMDIKTLNLKHWRYAGIYLHFEMSESTCR